MYKYLANKGDLFLANEVRAKSFELHEKIMEIDNKRLLSKERIVYFFNKNLAGYGENIWLPIGWMIEFNLLFVVLMLLFNLWNLNIELVNFLSFDVLRFIDVKILSIILLLCYVLSRVFLFKYIFLDNDKNKGVEKQNRNIKIRESLRFIPLIIIVGCIIVTLDLSLLFYYLKYFLSNFVPPLPDIVIGGHFDDGYTDMRKSWNPSMLWGFPKLWSAFMWYLVYKCVRFRNGEK
jgi:hypothetical protein